MIKKVLLLVVTILITYSATSQNKNQRIGYVDMEYILENIPAYTKAQAQLEKKVDKWKQNLNTIKKSIETLKADLSNEKALLTDDLIAERLEDISIKEDELKKLESSYFSSKGDLFLLRKQLVKPIQDQVYNSVQEIGKIRRYDIIFDKSSDIIMLYSNKNADVSELVLSSIVRGEKIKSINEKRDARNNSDDKNSGVDKGKIDTKREEREAKRAEAQEKFEKKKEERIKKREKQRAEIEARRLGRLKKREEVRKQLEENKKKKENQDDNNKN